jgi:hypothetical protein
VSFYISQFPLVKKDYTTQDGTNLLQSEKKRASKKAGTITGGGGQIPTPVSLVNLWETPMEGRERERKRRR